MAKIVIKKDKKEEPFDIEKLKESIRVNAIDSVLRQSEERINNLVEHISDKVVQSLGKRDKISTWELREKILAELDLAAPEVAKIWRDYDEQRGKS
jgi:transcriptional regulator NrdR family protein